MPTTATAIIPAAIPTSVKVLKLEFDVETGTDLLPLEESSTTLESVVSAVLDTLETFATVSELPASAELVVLGAFVEVEFAFVVGRGVGEAALLELVLESSVDPDLLSSVKLEVPLLL
ncbi:hypothetical protein PF004_g23942 [Phytophthora fragariae]|uniref:Uncharacterized protein n=1 Tax=Phytophthora fragariae TaxID=53985 RepID=A0A6G0MVM0_9STRA|nr:hypothetical protein PF004_g23942 [Phytophthora fragariae]